MPRPDDPRPGDREERKYPLAEARVPLIAAWIGARFTPDPQYPEGVITSCYYDTPRLAAWYESLDGDYAKAKHRIRWYGDPPDPAGRRMDRGQVPRRSPQRQAPNPARSPRRRPARPRPAPPRPDADGGRADPPRLPAAGRAAPDHAGPLPPQPLDRPIERSPHLPRPRRRGAEPRPVHEADGRPAWRPLRGGAVLELKSAGPLPIRLRGFARLNLHRTAHSKYALAVAEVLGDRAARA